MALVACGVLVKRRERFSEILEIVVAVNTGHGPGFDRVGAEAGKGMF